MEYIASLKHNIEAFSYTEPVYTGWSSVHWNATGMPLIHLVYTGIPLDDSSEYLQGTPQHHWKKIVEIVPHWNATGQTLSIVA